MLSQLGISLWNKLKNAESYDFATACYVTPFIFLLLLFLDSITFELTDSLFFALFLGSMLPMGILGLACTIIGIMAYRKKKHNLKVDTGIALIFLGLFISIGGLIGMALLYIVTN